MSFFDLSLGPLVWVAVAMGALWLFSVLLKDASIVDVFWGLGFVLIAAISNEAHGYGPRKALVGLLVALWGIRLAVHLVIRNAGKGEDPRYTAMRKRWGASFPVVSLFQVFVLQGVLMLVVSLPVQAAMRSPTPARVTLLDVAGTIVWVVGFAFEAVGDIQLTRFKSKRGNAKKVMDSGLWRYTRHPNYFGDAVQWWGITLIALSTHSWWAVAGPIVMTILLLRVSGVPLLERRMARTRPDYATYAARTSAFVPRPPRKAKESV